MAAKKGGTGLENLSLPGKIAVAVVFAFMVGAAYFVVFYGEIDGNIAAQKQLKDQKENELKGAKDADLAYNKDFTELERRKHTAQAQKKILPDSAEWAPFLDTIQRSATLSGITLATWEPKGEVPEDFFVKVPMEVKVSGRYHQVAKFFATIGTAARIINVADIGMKVLPATKKQTASSLSEGEESIMVEVKALAIAFRAVGQGDQKDDKKNKRGRRARTGRQ